MRGWLPDGYRVKVRLILEPAEGLSLGQGGWKDMPQEQWDELERQLAEFHERDLPRQCKDDVA